jgi:uncharacterized membrane protein
MKSKAHLGGHPLHPMLVLVPAGGVLFTFIFDVVHLISRDDAWWYATRPVLSVALLGAVLAAIPGLIDLVTVVPKGRATATGLVHLTLNAGLLVVLAVNTWLRWEVIPPVEGTPGFGWALVSAAILVASGWMGWRLVQTHHVGVLEVHEGGDAPLLESRRRTEHVGLHEPDEVTASK